MTYLTLSLMCWSILWAYWVFRWWGNKKTVYRQGYLVRAINSCAVLSAYALIYVPSFSVGWLGLRALPHGSFSQVAGSVLCILGVALAIWARHTIGTNWSGIITLKEGHALVQTGPYVIVRHPIYSGLILAMLGSAIVLGELRGLLSVGLMPLSFTRKMNDEERLMKTQFPKEYPEYQARVKRLIPFLY